MSTFPLPCLALSPSADDQADPGLMEQIEAVVQRLGVCLGTRARFKRGRTLDSTSQSRRDGFRPLASEHVRRALMADVLGVSVNALAWGAKVHPVTIRESLRVGRLLLRENAKALGLERPERPAYSESND